MPRVKPHFKIHNSIANHPSTAAMWANLEDRAMYCELGRIANEKYASYTDNTVHLTVSDIFSITTVETAGPASMKFKAFIDRCTRAATLQGVCPCLDGAVVGGCWRVTIRNLAKRQGFNPKNVTPSLRQERREKREELSTIFLGALTLSEGLRDRVLNAHPNNRLPKDLTAWMNEYERVIRIDGRTPKAVTLQLDWLFGENARNEISFVVQSPKAHRAKFDRIELAMDRSPKKKADRKNKERESVEKRERDQRNRENKEIAKQRQADGLPISDVMKALLGNMGVEGGGSE